MNRAVITGVSGFVGARLEKFLHEKEFELLGIDDDYLEGLEWQKELSSRITAFKPEAIFHVGACADTLEQSANYMMLRNYESTKVLKDIADLVGAKFIYSSSAANYGVNNKYPSNLYGWSKYVAEDYVRLTGGISLRYFNVYGPGENHKGNMASFLHQAFLKKQNSEDIKLFPGSPSRDFIHIEDVISANFFAFTEFDAISGKVFEVSTGESHTFEEVLELANLDFTYTDETEIPIGYQFYTKGNPATHLPGWQPQVSLELGVKSYIEFLASAYAK